MSENPDSREPWTWENKWPMAVAAFVILILVLLWGLPQYKIYRLRASGKAALEEAKWEKQVAIEEAKAADESADYYKSAGIKRAHGVAEENAIIGESLKGNEAYLRYLWIQGMKDENSEVYYIPTEAGMPILEAGRSVDKRAGPPK